MEMTTTHAPDSFLERRWEGPTYWRSCPTADLESTRDEIAADPELKVDLADFLTAVDAEINRRHACVETAR
jgi:hypothetical protein